MPFCAIEREASFLATMIALAYESVGHRCLVLTDLAELSHILHAVRVDKVVIDLDRPGLNALDWLETMVPSWPDLPSRTVLLAESELTPRDAARIKQLGAEFVSRPSSLVAAKLVVMERLQQSRSDRTDRELHALKQQILAKATESGQFGKVSRRRWNGIGAEESTGG